MEILFVPVVFFGILILLLAWWEPTRPRKKKEKPELKSVPKKK